MKELDNIAKQADLDNKSFKCQMITQFSAASTLNMFDKMLLIFLRLYSAFLRRLKRMRKIKKKKKTEKITYEQSNIDNSKIAKKGEVIKEGDTVYILSFKEIEKTLDDHRKAQGLEFMEGMQKFCGKTAKVMKKVKYIYDENTAKMRKLKDVVILEGILCDGKGTFGSEGCDRCCYFFWKEAWLRKYN